MTDAFLSALDGVEIFDPDKASRLLVAYAAIGQEGLREEVLAYIEALARKPYLN